LVFSACIHYPKIWMFLYVALKHIDEGAIAKNLIMQGVESIS
jgi:hypothetical protein